MYVCMYEYMQYNQVGESSTNYSQQLLAGAHWERSKVQGTWDRWRWSGLKDRRSLVGLLDQLSRTGQTEPGPEGEKQN